MIFVTLGTQDKEFKRLIDIILNYLKETGSDEEKETKTKIEIVIQYGNTKYDYEVFDKYSNVKCFDFISPEDFDQYMNEAEVIITHAGVGTIINGLNKNKKLIVVPRLKKYKEHVNDHQLQITDNFAQEGYIIELGENDSLKEKIKQAKDFKPKKFVSNNKKFNYELEKIINK